MASKEKLIASVPKEDPKLLQLKNEILSHEKELKKLENILLDAERTYNKELEEKIDIQKKLDKRRDQILNSIKDAKSDFQKVNSLNIILKTLDNEIEENKIITSMSYKDWKNNIAMKIANLFKRINIIKHDVVEHEKRKKMFNF